MSATTDACGTTTGYARGCRCERCREALNAYQRRFRAGHRSKKGRPFKPIQHGTTHAYVGRGCRCRTCRLFWREYSREIARRRRGTEKERVCHSICACCGKNFVIGRGVSDYCSHACYAKAWRARKKQRVSFSAALSPEAAERVLRRENERQRAEVAEAAAQNEELARLMQEQERDARVGDFVSHAWLKSLDAYIGDGDATLAEIVGSDSLNPAAVLLADEEAERIRTAIGDRTEEELRRLDYRTLEWLGARLQEEGLVSSIAVTQEERRRIRDPQTHSGEKVLASKSWGGKARRREKLRANRHGRPSQKPRKRWSRDEWEAEAA